MNSLRPRLQLEAVTQRLEMLISSGILVGIKVETESEGASAEFISRLRTISGQVGIPLTLKIGGPSARRDLFLALDNLIDGVTGPMIETSFAASQLEESLTELEMKDFFSEINLLVESVEGIKNLPAILGAGKTFANGIVFGRSDFARSLRHFGFEAADVENNLISEQIETGVTLANRMGFKTTVGGVVSQESEGNIRRFIECGLDRVETRRFVLDAQAAIVDWKALGEVLKIERQILRLEEDLYEIRRSYLQRSLVETERRLKQTFG